MLRKPLKVCFFSKYPPIEGGVSSKTYWLSRALGKRGIEIHIVTNALEVEELYRQIISLKKEEDLKEYQPQNVFVHSLSQSLAPFYIPFSPAYLERLINLGIKVIRQYNCDLIDSHYLQPYGLAAVFAKLFTGKPCILRHAGSDLFRLFPNKEFRDLYKMAFDIADIIVTSGGTKKLWRAESVSEDKLWLRPFQGVDPEHFNPEVKPASLSSLGVPAKLLKKPILTYLGKYGPHKSLYELVKAVSEVRENFLLFFITGGGRLEEFKKYVQEFPSLKNKYYFSRFLPPWQIPAVLRASSCLFHLESGFPIKAHMSIQPFEAFATATPVLVSYEIFQKYKRISYRLEKNRNVFAVNPQDHAELKRTLLEIIRNPQKLKEAGRLGYEEVFDKEHFEEMIQNQLLLYQKTLKNLFWKKINRSFKNIFCRILPKASFPQEYSEPHRSRRHSDFQLRHPSLS